MPSHATAIQSPTTSGAGGGLAVGKTKMSLVDDDDEESAHLASSQASRQSASKSEYASDDELAGPVVKGEHLLCLGPKFMQLHFHAIKPPC